MVNENTRFCPICGADWRGAPIPEAFRKYYLENTTHFSRLIGIETQGYDGVSIWRCPDCGDEWDRFTGKKISVDKAAHI